MPIQRVTKKHRNHKLTVVRTVERIGKMIGVVRIVEGAIFTIETGEIGVLVEYRRSWEVIADHGRPASD